MKISVKAPKGTIGCDFCGEANKTAIIRQDTDKNKNHTGNWHKVYVCVKCKGKRI